MRIVIWKFASLGLGTALLYWTFAALPMSDLAARLEVLRAGELSLAAGLILLTFWLRAARWAVLLDNWNASGTRIAFSALMVGNLINNVVPARGGDLVRALSYGSRTGTGAGRALATIVVERIVDLAVAAGLVMMTFTAMPWGGAIQASAPLALAGGVAVLGALATWLAYRHRSGWHRAMNRIVPASLRARLGPRVARASREFKAGLLTLRKPTVSARFTALTLLLWACEIVLVMQLARAFGLNLGPTHAALAMLFAIFGTFIPALPGQFGAFEFSVMTILTALGHPAAAAAVFALGWHIGLILMSALIGVLCLAATPGLRLSRGGPDPDPIPRSDRVRPR